MRLRCRTTPSTSQVSSRSGAAPPTSSGVTIQGPTGVACSNVLPWSHWAVRFCQSRMEMSLATVNPAIAAAASSGDACRTARPITTVSSTSQSTMSDTGGQQDVVVRTDKRVAVLGEQRGEVGLLAAHLGDVVGVVHTDADDLAGIEHERREVGGVERVLLPGHVLVSCRSSERVSSGTQERADVGIVELDEHVAFHAGRVRPVAGSNRCQPHRRMLSHAPGNEPASTDVV